jgi:hypothetical protein
LPTLCIRARDNNHNFAYSHSGPRTLTPHTQRQGQRQKKTKFRMYYHRWQVQWQWFRMCYHRGQRQWQKKQILGCVITDDK